ncbi:hypothetical protein AwDysgo_05780 [Bacteroidales bacterium]|nr:hypothetical protein AwDysgo_05780 [Bacteroidales bacterium]
MKHFTFFISLFIVALSVALSSCDALNSNTIRELYYLDNPTDHTIVIKLDEKEYSLEPQTYVSFKLPSGLHKLTYDGQSISFNTSDKAHAGILNATGSYYFTELIAYVVQEKDRDNYRESQNYSNDFFIQQGNSDWSYFLYETPENVITTRNRKEVGRLVSKIFSEQEFLTAIGDPNYLDDAPRMSLDQYKRTSITVPEFENEDLNVIANNIAALLEEFISEPDGDKMIEKRNQVMQASSAISEIPSYKISAADREPLHTFSTETSAILMKNVRIQ